MPISVNDNGVIRRFSKMQVNDNGIIRNLKKIQVNDNGIIRVIFSGGNITVDFTGNSIINIKSEKQGYIILTSSGTFTFTDSLPETVDIYLVGRGMDASATAGTAGSGGYVRKYLGVTLPAVFDADLPDSGSAANARLLVGETELFSSSGGTRAGVGAVNTLTDFWGRNWASGGGNSTSGGAAGDGGSNGSPGVRGGGGSSPIGGGGGAGGTYDLETPGNGGIPNGGKGGESYRGAGQNATNGGGGGGGGNIAGGLATGGGGNGGTSQSDQQTKNKYPTGGGGGLGGGGGGGGYSGSVSKEGRVAQGGGGAIIIRWGDSPL